MSEVSAVTDATFEEEVLVRGACRHRFLNQWCGPCRQMALIVDEVADFGDKVKFGVDNQPGHGPPYGVRSILTFAWCATARSFHQFAGRAPRPPSRPRWRRSWPEAGASALSSDLHASVLPCCPCGRVGGADVLSRRLSDVWSWPSSGPSPPAGRSSTVNLTPHLSPTSSFP